MSNDNTDIENLLNNDQIFKPLTEGLGFHHSIKNKNEIKTDLAQKKIMLKEDLQQRSNELGRKSISHNQNHNQNTNLLNMGELSAFYSQQEPKENQIDLKITSSSQEYVSASWKLRLAAWLVDLLLLSTIICVAFISIVFISQIPLSYVRVNLVDLDFALSVFLISFLFSSFYFSFFDKTSFSTPGKRLFGLTVLTIKGTPVRLVQSFTRFLIIAISLVTLGLGAILRLQDHFTDTIVVKK